jgi:hypothetical protein
MKGELKAYRVQRITWTLDKGMQPMPGIPSYFAMARSPRGALKDIPRLSEFAGESRGVRVRVTELQDGVDMAHTLLQNWDYFVGMECRIIRIEAR